MDKQVKEYWLDALRSDEYVQGIGYLERDGRYCCLGVLIDACDGIARGNTRLDQKWQESIGLTDYQSSELIDLNDDHKASFDEIADWIEVYL